MIAPMFSTHVPRVFILTCFALLFLVIGTNYYLYDDVPYYPPSSVRPVSFGNGLADEVGVKPQEDAISYGKPPSSVAETEIPVQGSDDPHRPAPVEESAAPANTRCDPGLAFLKQTNLERKFTNNTVVYSRRCIQPVFSDTVDRDEVARIADPITDLPRIIDLENCDHVKLTKCEPIKLTVPKPYPKASFSHLIFGIATTYDRLGASLDAFAHWLAGTDAQLIALVTDFHARNVSAARQLEKQFHDAGVNATLVGPLDDKFTTSQSHFTVLVHMLNHSNVDTQWFSLVDDDTFYPNLTPLSDALGKLNHTIDVYAGTLSEDFNAVKNFGIMAFGGAGAYLSAPLAKKVGAKASKCIGEIKTREGDTLLRDCVYRNSKAKLTSLHGLYQQDFRGDVSGFFESGVRPINLHHWKSWYKEPVVKMAKVADFCGDCFLQRWQFFPDTVLANGYSIVQYRDGFDDLDLQTMEGTFDGNIQGQFDFSIGPFRRKLDDSEKKSYKLSEVHVNDKGELRQLYILQGNKAAGELDEVVELIWQSSSTVV